MIYIVIYTFAVFILTTHLLLALGWCFYSPLPTLLFCLGGVALCGSYYLLGKIISKNKKNCHNDSLIFTATIPTLLSIVSIIGLVVGIQLLGLSECFVKSIGFGVGLFGIELYIITALLSDAE